MSIIGPRPGDVESKDTYNMQKTLLIIIDNLLIGGGQTVTEEEVKLFNDSLDSWEQRQGKCLVQKEGYVYIDFYERTTLTILKRLLELSRFSNKEYRLINQRFIKDN